MKFKFLLILMLITPSYSYAENIKFYINKQYYGEMTVEQFQALQEGASIYNDLLKSELNKQVKVTVINNINTDGPTQIEIHVIWYTEKKEILKQLTILSDVTFKEGTMSTLRSKYRDVSEVGFPVSSIVILLVILLHI